MVEIADIFRLHGSEYRSQFRDRMPPSHLRTMDAIEHCRTEALGGQLYFCDQCQERLYSYHSCIMGSHFLWGVGCRKCLVPLVIQVF
jgi:Transposase zinc-binding domain